MLKVGPEGGLATPVTTEAEGIPLKFTNDLDIDEDGSIYFTDSSTNYQRRYFFFRLLSNTVSKKNAKPLMIISEMLRFAFVSSYFGLAACLMFNGVLY